MMLEPTLGMPDAHLAKIIIACIDVGTIRYLFWLIHTMQAWSR